MYCHILRVRAIPTLESTDSMILLPPLEAEYTMCMRYVLTSSFSMLLGNSHVTHSHSSSVPAPGLGPHGLLHVHVYTFAWSLVFTY